MPSRNSINKPKDTMNQAHRRAAVAKKRAARARRGDFAPPRSAAASQSGEIKSTALALYTGAVEERGPWTTKTLSNKRKQKIERNKKYVAARNNKLLIDAQATAEEKMDVDEEPNPVQKKLIKKNTVKDALWSVIEDGVTSQLIVDAQGEGTTLGGPVF
ncbi:hypothetical protein WICPIJ_004043 [Wickerhamomyces pijperi]|uniref:Ribosome biogenesis protein ALB1 n=1 Tax=Wickerhamomyces pijperi TaxID=599730 RepID=A0A9P8TNP3_WICPI|nr:hypothetical protein WICPIJ_004043 [Wickerhamomyces pijperi]